MERRARRDVELPAVVVSTAATVRPAALPGYRQVLRHHRWGAGLVFVILFAATLVATLVPIPVYRATALVDGNGGTVLPLTRTLAERALARLEPGEDPLPAPPLVVARLLARATARVRRQLGLPVLEDAGGGGAPGVHARQSRAVGRSAGEPRVPQARRPERHAHQGPEPAHGEGGAVQAGDEREPRVAVAGREQSGRRRPRHGGREARGRAGPPRRRLPRGAPAGADRCPPARAADGAGGARRYRARRLRSREEAGGAARAGGPDPASRGRRR